MAPKYRFAVLTVGCLVTTGLFLPPDAAAQRRGGSHSAGRSVAVARPVYSRPIYYRPAYYRPAYYYPGFSPYYYYNPFIWGWGGYGYRYNFGIGYGYGYGYGYQYPGPYPYPYYWGGVYDRTGAARLQVTPKETQVFVDGYFVGRADEFDGAMQRLRVDAGEHELQLYLDGYRTLRQPVLFRREGTITIKHAMEPVAAGEASDRPTPIEPPAAQRPSQDYSSSAPPEGYRGRPGERTPPPAGGQRDDFGTLAIRVQPGDAEILIDGERWDGSADGGSRLSVELGEGPHRIEIRREGYRSYTANVRIRRGQTEALNVSLTK